MYRMSTITVTSIVFLTLTLSSKALIDTVNVLSSPFLRSTSLLSLQARPISYLFRAYRSSTEIAGSYMFKYGDLRCHVEQILLVVTLVEMEETLIIRAPGDVQSRCAGRREKV